VAPEGEQDKNNQGGRAWDQGNEERGGEDHPTGDLGHSAPGARLPLPVGERQSLIHGWIQLPGMSATEL
jgi:hypothetical protein